MCSVPAWVRGERLRSYTTRVLSCFPRGLYRYVATLPRELPPLPRRNIPPGISVHPSDGREDTPQPRRGSDPPGHHHGGNLGGPRPQRNCSAGVNCWRDHRGTVSEWGELGLRRSVQGLHAEEIVLLRFREEYRVGEDASDGAGDSVTVEVPPGRRGILEQAAIAVRVAVEAQGLLVPILQGYEIAVLPEAGVLPAIGVEREVFHLQ